MGNTEPEAGGGVGEESPSAKGGPREEGGTGGRPP